MSDRTLGDLQRAFGYFLKETNPANGLVPDNTRKGSHCSITAVGLALASYAIGVERGFISRAEAIERTLTTLRFFRDSPQSEDPDATGYRGFYYHFLDMQTGRRAWKSELSTIDTTFLLAGALLAAAYFDGESAEEREIRAIVSVLYGRVDWRWAQNGALRVSHGWKPESGFLPHRWRGYCEALLLYVLGLGSPTHALSAGSYRAWTESYRWKKLYGIEFLYAGPLFIHQLSHVWIDFRGIQDDYMREMGIDYFENSRRATYVQQQYAIRNPRKFRGYGENCWGITTSDGPGPAIRRIDGIERRFYDYRVRSIPFGPDDGTIAPWAAIASLPFAPEIVLPALQHFDYAYPEMTSHYGFKCSFNPTFAGDGQSPRGWISKGYYGIDQGPIILMIENFRSGLPWRLMRQCPYIVTGLRHAGFGNGWLEGPIRLRQLPARTGHESQRHGRRSAANVGARDASRGEAGLEGPPGRWGAAWHGRVGQRRHGDGHAANSGLTGMAYIEYDDPGTGDNIIRISSVHPAALRAHRRLYRTLVKDPSPLSRVRREMIAVAVSQINDCHY